MSWDFSQRQLVVDWSNHQGALPAGTLRQARVAMLIHKATEGASYRDPYFAGNIALARHEGVLLGAYHFLLGGVDPRTQARNFLGAVGTSGDVALFLDVEARKDHPDPTADEAAEFSDEVRSLGVTRPVTVYTGRWYWVGHLGNPDGSRLGMLWDSAYVGGHGDPWQLLGNLQPGDTTGAGVTPDYFPPYGGWTIHTRALRQYSSSAQIAGRAVDVSVFYGTRAALALCLIGDAIGTNPVPAPTVTEDDDMLLVSEGTQWSICDATGRRYLQPSEYQAYVAMGVRQVKISAAQYQALAVPSVTAIAAKVVAALPKGTGGSLTQTDVEAAVRAVFADAGSDK